MAKTCSCSTKDASPFLYNVGGKDMAIYGQIQPLSDTLVPYWCKPISAYNDSPPTGYMPLSSSTLKGALPVQAKYSLRLIADDLQDGIKRDPSYYGTVLNAGGRWIKYDPSVMTGKVAMVPADQFLQSVDTAKNTPASGTSKTDGSAPQGTTGNNLVDQAEDLAKNHPLAVSAGLLLMLFGVATLASIKK